MSQDRKKRWAFVVDLRRCIGCHSCSVACKSENDVPLGVWRSWVKQTEKGEYPYVLRAFVPTLCNQCDEAPCVQVCPVKASYRRDDGIVMINPHLCIGCRTCMSYCPYDMRYVNPLRRIVQKCYFCAHRLDQGLKPACVAACPANARYIGDLNDKESEVYRLINTNGIQTLKPEANTHPHVFYIGADLAAMEARGGAPWKKLE